MTQRKGPQHVGIIMDGNGRWAKARLLPRAAGHRAGMKRMIALSEHIFASGVTCCTVYALSAENLNRPREEVDGLFDLFREYFTENVSALSERGIRLKIIGDRSLLPPDIADMVCRSETECANGTRGTLAIAIAYGARQDIARAAQMLAAQGEAITAESLERRLSTGDLPPLDLVIRTGKEKRLSNFLLFEAAYAELFFSDKLFPDYSDGDFDRDVAEFLKRDRRFGTV